MFTFSGKKTQLRSSARAGFSLIELMVVVAIMAILVTAGIVSYTTVTKKARDSKRKSDMEQLRAALVLYRTDLGYYPPTGSVNFGNMSPLQSYVSVTSMSDPKTGGAAYTYTGSNCAGLGCRGFSACATMETQSPANYCVTNP